MAIEVRAARKADIPTLAHVLDRAFYDDPVITWMLPDEKTQPARLHRLFASLTRHHHFAGGGVEVACDGPRVAAAALWDPPNRWKQSPREQLAMLPSVVYAFGHRAAAARHVIELMKPTVWPMWRVPRSQRQSRQLRAITAIQLARATLGAQRLIGSALPTSELVVSCRVARNCITR